MFDRVGDLAEQMAGHVSRRAFLGRLGQGALGVAVAMAGVLTTAATARAGTKSCCSYCNPINPGNTYLACVQGSCPTYGPKGGVLCSSLVVTGCGSCH